jgi:hypothetical protein
MREGFSETLLGEGFRAFCLPHSQPLLPLRGAAKERQEEGKRGEEDRQKDIRALVRCE